VLRRVAGNLALVVISFALALGAFEAGLRWLEAPISPEPVTGDQYEFYRFDAELGWTNSSGATGLFARKEFAYKVRINSQGLRGPEVSRLKPAGVRRIAVIGDSYTWGIGATDAELFTTLIGQGIAGSEVLNFGVAGYGPVQYDLLTPRVLEFAPDVVVVAFCLGNDFVDNVFWRRYGYYKPFVRLEKDRTLVTDGYPLPQVNRFRPQPDSGLARWLLDNSYVVQLFDSIVLGTILRVDNYGQKGPDISQNQGDIYRRPDSPAADGLVAVNHKLFERIAADYLSRDIPVIVMAVPTKCEFGRCFPEEAKVDAARQALARSLAGLPVTLIDPTDSYSLADFWDRDGHWRPSGHRKAADALIPAIARALSR
jgi:hypothetical protein